MSTEHATEAGRMIGYETIRSWAEAVLRQPERYEWQLQGFGMLRTYLSKEVRLHVWDSRYRVLGVSDIHDHPWSFRSIVLAGVVRQFRFVEGDGGPRSGKYKKVEIRCGAGACTTSEPVEVGLTRAYDEFGRGWFYWQKWNEIHQSFPDDGTVTLVHRQFHADTEHARVYFPTNRQWISAEPRPATPEEVQAITENALKTWW